MENNQIVLSTNLADLKDLCRICLTKSKQIVSLYDKLEKQEEPNVSIIYDALCRVMTTEVPQNDCYPSYICSLCMSFLNLSYKLQLQFEKSQSFLEKCLKSCKAKNSQKNSHETSSNRKKYKVSRGVQVNLYNEEEPKGELTVQLIAGNNRYNVEDVVVIEENKTEKHTFDGFLKNLGTVISAHYVGKNEQQKKKPVDITSSVSIIKRLKTTKYVQIDESLNETKVTDAVNEQNFNIQEEFYCEICKKSFNSPYTLKRHTRVLHKKSLKPPQCFLCQSCGFVANTRSNLYHHIRAKHRERQYTCNICDKKFILPSNLRAHLLIHKNLRPYLCSVCGKGFNYASALEYHMRLHTGEKKYECPYCDRRFTMSCSLKRHIRCHTGKRPFKCNYCEKTFRSKGEQKVHEMLHTGFRPYHCKHCGKGFTKTHNMRIHLLGHGGPHFCDLCGKNFIEVEYLKMHLKISHAVLENEEMQDEK